MLTGRNRSLIWLKFELTEKGTIRSNRQKKYLLRERLRRRKGEAWRPRLLPRLITAFRHCHVAHPHPSKKLEEISSVLDPDRMFLSLPDPNQLLSVRIRILPSQSKNSKKNLDFYCFATSL
jgi:hypothetical protein